MGVGDVIAQQHGAGSLTELTEAMSESSSAEQASETASSASVSNVESPTLTFVSGGTEYTFDTQTLILYGIVLADILLLYIALRV